LGQVVLVGVQYLAQVRKAYKEAPLPQRLVLLVVIMAAEVAGLLKTL
jgi:hypothetical protein